VLPEGRLSKLQCSTTSTHQFADVCASQPVLPCNHAPCSHPQAAQALGGSVQLWQDSVLCYALARRSMPGRGPADALEALQGGVALLGTTMQ
jgi:hypothetical protein